MPTPEDFAKRAAQPLREAFEASFRLVKVTLVVATEGEPMPDSEGVWTREAVQALHGSGDGLGGVVCATCRPDGTLEAVFHGKLRLFSQRELALSRAMAETARR